MLNGLTILAVFFCTAGGLDWNGRDRTVSGPDRPTIAEAERAAVQSCQQLGLMTCQVRSCLQIGM